VLVGTRTVNPNAARKPRMRCRRAVAVLLPLAFAGCSLLDFDGATSGSGADASNDLAAPKLDGAPVTNDRAVDSETQAEVGIDASEAAVNGPETGADASDAGHDAPTEAGPDGYPDAGHDACASIGASHTFCEDFDDLDDGEWRWINHTTGASSLTAHDNGAAASPPFSLLATSVVDRSYPDGTANAFLWKDFNQWASRIVLEVRLGDISALTLIHRLSLLRIASYFPGGDSLNVIFAATEGGLVFSWRSMVDQGEALLGGGASLLAGWGSTKGVRVKLDVDLGNESVTAFLDDTLVGSVAKVPVASPTRNYGVGVGILDVNTPSDAGVDIRVRADNLWIDVTP